MTEAPDANKPAKNTMDSRAVKEYNRYEDSALRLTDPRFIESGETANAHRQAAAGLGYGKNHSDHYSYYALKGKASVIPATTNTDELHKVGPMKEWDRWMTSSHKVLNGPPVENPYVLLARAREEKERAKAAQAKTRDISSNTVIKTEKDHRFMFHPRSKIPKARTAAALGYGPGHHEYSSFLAARNEHDVKETTLNCTTHNWDTYQKHLGNPNVLNSSD